MLESVNIKGQLVLVDGAPDYFKNAAFIKYSTENFKYRADIIMNLVKTVYPQMELNLSEIMAEDTTDPIQKLDKLLKSIAVKEDDKLTKIGNGIVARVKFFADYDDSHLKKIDAQVTLIRTSNQFDIDIDEAYGLNKNTLKMVAVKYTEGNHYTMLANEQLPKIINGIFLE
jgi:hypothetical protein